MSYYLDVKTIILLLAIGHLLSSILIIAYVYKSKTERSVSLFIFSKLFALTSWILILLRGHISNLLSVLLANYFLIIGTTLEIIAFLILVECYNRSIARIYLAVCVLYALLFNIIYLFHNIESARVMLISVFIVLLWSYPILRLFIYRGASLLQRFIAVLYGAGVLTFLARAIAVFVIGRSMTLTSANFFNALAFLSLYIVMIIGSIGFILLAKQKSDLKLLHAATYDLLTGAYCRRAFIEKACSQIGFHIRKERPISLLSIDLDHFKKINDSYGHQIGDTVLKEFVAKIKSQLQTYDFIGRFGGEEFLILLPETQRKEAEEAAARMRLGIEVTPVIVDGHEIFYTISIGAVSLIPNQAVTFDLLYNYSDQALYTAKEAGRNRVEFFQEQTEIFET